MSSLISWFFNHINYWVITLLMTLESTVVPVPSELVVAPAAYKAAEDGELSVFLIILFATIGADLGATINYVVARYLGRPGVYAFAISRLGRLCLLNDKKIKKTEDYFNEHGAVGTLIGRLVPGIRHLISIPAGLAQMNYSRFLLYTTIGAGVWNIILAALGYYMQSVLPQDQMLTAVEQYSHEIGLAMLGLFLLFIVYLVYKEQRKKK